MPSSVDNEYASLSAVYGPGLSIQDMRFRKYGGPTVPAKSVADLEYMYWGPSTTLSNADKKLAYLQNQTGKTGQSIDDLTSLSIGSATTTVRNIVDRPAPVAPTNWSTNDAAKWTVTYSGGIVSVERTATADPLLTVSFFNLGLLVGNPVLANGSQWQRSVEVFSTVPVTVVASTGGFPTGQVIPANVWTTVRNNFIADGTAKFWMGLKLQAASDPGLGILTQLRHAMLVRDDSIWRTNQAINPGYEGAALTSILTGSSAAYPVTTDTVAPISGTKSALFTRAGTLTSTIAQILGASGIAAAKFTVTAGQPVTGGISIKTDVPNAQIATRWFWYDSGSVLTTGNSTTRYTNINAGQVYRVVDTDTPPPGTVTAYFVVTVVTNSGNAALGNQVWADMLTLEYGTTDGSWFAAGSFTGTVDASTSVVATKQIAYADGRSTGWSWEGTADASPSTGPASYVGDTTGNPAVEGPTPVHNFYAGNTDVTVSDGDLISSWPNLSGGGTLTNGGGTERPTYKKADPLLNGKPSLQFGVGTSHLKADITDIPQTYYMVGIATNTGAPGLARGLINAGSVTTIGGIGYRSSGTWYCEAGSLLDSAIQQNTSPTLVVAKLSGATSEIQINNGIPTVGSAGASAVSWFKVGCLGVAGAFNAPWIGSIAFVAIYTSDPRLDPKWSKILDYARSCGVAV